MKRVLIADGNHAARTTLRHLFEQEGWNVCGEASDGEQAVAKGQELSPDLIVLELSMRLINGLAAARILKKTMPDIRLILFRYFGSLVNSDELISAGFSASVPKTEAGRLITTARSSWKQHELPNFCPQNFGQLSHYARKALRRMRKRTYAGDCLLAAGRTVSAVTILCKAQ